jgi:hypothetical protein
MKKLFFPIVFTSSFPTGATFPGNGKRGKSILVFKRIFAVWLPYTLLVLALFPSAMVAAQSGYNSHDFNKLQTFLNQNSVEPGLKNGKVLNTSYNQDDPATWTGVIWTGGAGAERRVTEIKWSGINKLAGNLDVSECTALLLLQTETG